MLQGVLRQLVRYPVNRNPAVVDRVVSSYLNPAHIRHLWQRCGSQRRNCSGNFAFGLELRPTAERNFSAVCSLVVEGPSSIFATVVENNAIPARVLSCIGGQVVCNVVNDDPAICRVGVFNHLCPVDSRQFWSWGCCGRALGSQHSRHFTTNTQDSEVRVSGGVRFLGVRGNSVVGVGSIAATVRQDGSFRTRVAVNVPCQVVDVAVESEHARRLGVLLSKCSSRVVLLANRRSGAAGGGNGRRGSALDFAFTHTYPAFERIFGGVARNVVERSCTICTTHFDDRLLLPGVDLHVLSEIVDVPFQCHPAVSLRVVLSQICCWKW
mmetsp:Transcript_25107/g.49415  ORF Transcript_25107/g.49415 Transcript_25107/m.49415 type:complete len:324 (-) Transcript_25107:864-1835(-)